MGEWMRLNSVWNRVERSCGQALERAGLWPQASIRVKGWGSSVLGLSDGQLRKARRAAAEASFCAERGASVSGQLLVAGGFGRGADQAYAANKNPLVAWASALREARQGVGGYVTDTDLHTFRRLRRF